MLLCSGPAFGKPAGAPFDLAQMAGQKFTAPPLSAAEKRVVQHASDGTVADCSNLGGGDDPGTADAPDGKWPDTRNVRAD